MRKFAKKWREIKRNSHFLGKNEKKWAKKIGRYIPGIGTTILEIDLAEDQAQGIPDYFDKLKQEKEAWDFVDDYKTSN